MQEEEEEEEEGKEEEEEAEAEEKGMRDVALRQGAGKHIKM